MQVLQYCLVLFPYEPGLPSFQLVMPAHLPKAGCLVTMGLTVAALCMCELYVCMYVHPGCTPCIIFKLNTVCVDTVLNRSKALKAADTTSQSVLSPYHHPATRILYLVVPLCDCVGHMLPQPVASCPHLAKFAAVRLSQVAPCRVCAV